MSTPETTPTKNLYQAAVSPERTGHDGPANILQAGISPESEKPKKKRFRGIRGFLKGESRKERKTRKAMEAAMKNLKKVERPEDNEAEPAEEDSVNRNSFSDINTEDGCSTVYGVDLDTVVTGESLPTLSKEETTARDFLNTPVKAKKKRYTLVKVVLLLLDPETRRFELLQLEFDTEKAVVSDVLSQISVAVTEKALTKLTYVSICKSTGAEVEPDALLSSFSNGNEVLLAIPTGIPASEAVRLAKPILCDPKVYSMLVSGGISAAEWVEVAKEVAPAEISPEKAPEKLEAALEEPEAALEKPEAAPEKPEAAPEEPEAAPEKPEAVQGESRALEPVVEPSLEPAAGLADSLEATEAAVEAKEPTSEPKAVPGIELNSREVTFEQTVPAATKRASSGLITMKFMSMIIVGLISVALQQVHVRIASPLKVGDVLAPGSFRNTCGLLTPLSSCQKSSIVMGDDGVLSYHQDGRIEWELRGGVCKEGEDECINGLEVRQDGVVVIGNKPMTWVSVRKGYPGLSPFPFAESPRLKVIFAKQDYN